MDNLSDAVLEVLSTEATERVEEREEEALEGAAEEEVATASVGEWKLVEEEGIDEEGAGEAWEVVPHAASASYAG